MQGPTEAEIGLVQPHPVEHDAEFACQRDFGPLGDVHRPSLQARQAETRVRSTRPGRAVNAAKRAGWPIAIGRRNWTFAGSDARGRRVAAMDTLIKTAKLNGVDLRA